MRISLPTSRTAGLSLGAVLAVAATIALAGVTSASAAPLFTDTFEDGNRDGWTTSGGSWSVVSDASGVLRQASASSDSRARVGQSTWTDYTVTARVKPTAFNGSNRFAAVLARAQSNTSYYLLALTSGNTVELKRLVSGGSTTLATAAVQVTPGSWYSLSLTVAGSTLTGRVNDGTTVTATDARFTSGQAGLATYYTAANFDDVSVDGSGSTPPTGPPPPSGGPPSGGPPSTPTPSSPTPSNPPHTMPPAPSDPALVGWATQNGGTTGGAGGPTVTVSSLAELTAAARASAAQTIRVNGNFTCSADVRVTSNKTILGVGSTSGLTGCGLRINDVHNVVVRNMRIGFVRAGNGNGDAIHVDGSTNLWIDHNDLSSDTSHDIDYYDGLLDLTHAADFVTVSWNRLHDHKKCSLVGHSDNNAAEDTGHLRITYHHNWFDNCQERSPRVRFANPLHVFNNYYSNISGYAVTSTENAGVLVEGNYFENVPDPFHVGHADSGPGALVARDNVFVNSGTGQAAGSVAGLPYGYALEAAAAAKSSVTSSAGTGKIPT